MDLVPIDSGCCWMYLPGLLIYKYGCHSSLMTCWDHMLKVIASFGLSWQPQVYSPQLQWFLQVSGNNFWSWLGGLLRAMFILNVPRKSDRAFPRCGESVPTILQRPLKWLTPLLWACTETCDGTFWLGIRWRMFYISLRQLRGWCLTVIWGTGMVINGQSNILGGSGINWGGVEHRLQESRGLKICSRTVGMGYNLWFIMELKLILEWLLSLGKESSWLRCIKLTPGMSPWLLSYILGPNWVKLCRKTIL